MSLPLKWLRPCLRPQLRRASVAARRTYLDFYHSVRSYSTQQANDTSSSPDDLIHPGEVQILEGTPRVRTSTEEERYTPEPYPRIAAQKGVIDYEAFKKLYYGMRRGETLSEEVVVRGRIKAFRVAGSKLAFIDIFQNNRVVSQNANQLQCVLNHQIIAKSGISPGMFKDFLATLHRGDIFSFKGNPYRTDRLELSIKATELPQLLSRCAQPLPTDDLKDQETLMRNRHVNFLLNSRPADIIHLRSEITKFLRQYLLDDKYVEVQTPILADKAGGAVARSFRTSATEFPDRQLALRIAPELWLKRLILGGFEKVFEIGPSFRNEGIDLNHNPEFTTCEFYKAFANLEELQQMTETMFYRLSRTVDSLLYSTCRSLEPVDVDFSPPYRRLDFIPAIEECVGRKLPLLTSPEAQASLLQLFSDRDIPLPALPTLPRLLDKLSSTLLEPACVAPTWIVNHPECLSPLSKSFDHPENQQRVAARAELYINQQEFVNTYEEENSPIEQRRKFEEQLLHHEGDTEAGVDENYLQALQWGLPPTGGWGCGIDRLCMLFSNSTRIADVLTFGTLRNVVSLGQSGKDA